MDLVTLIAACALSVEPKLMHALVWEQSGGEPWSFSVPGESLPRVLPTIQDAIREARATRPDVLERRCRPIMDGREAPHRQPVQRLTANHEAPRDGGDPRHSVRCASRASLGREHAEPVAPFVQTRPTLR